MINIVALNLGGKGDDDSLQFIGGVYLHGELQDISGYDLIATDQKTAKLFETMEDGEYNVSVSIKGNSFDAIMYYWHKEYDYYGVPRREHRGLIVLPDDGEHALDAQEKYNKRVENL